MGSYNTGSGDIVGIIHSLQSRLSALERTQGPATAQVRRSSGQSIPLATMTQVQFNTVLFDHGGLAADPKELVVPTDGTYIAVLSLLFSQGNSVGYRFTRLEMAAGNLFTDMRGAPGTYSETTITGVAKLTAGNVIKAKVEHSDSGSITVTGSLAAYRLARI